MPDKENKNENSVDEASIIGAATITGLGAQYQNGDNFTNSKTNGSVEYPGSLGPPYAPNIKQLDSSNQRKAPAEIRPADHFRDGREPLPTVTPVNSMTFAKSKSDHFIDDYRQNISEGAIDAEAQYVRSTRMGDGTHVAGMVENPVRDVPIGPMEAVSTDRPMFSASVTDINQFNDPVTEKIISAGTLSSYLEEDENETGAYKSTPVSPLAPFTKMNTPKEPFVATKTLFTAYNRTKLPIADTAWRKGFRHIFITRPECYVWGKNGSPGGQICYQALNDEDFQSSYTRMPHILRLLAPYYVSGSYPKSDVFSCNWNFLLSNMVQGLSSSDITLSISENVTKSIEGYTVTPGAFLEGRQGSSLDLTFKDTNNLEVFEFLRLWQLYIYKRKKGIFTPPFNGYQVSNAFKSAKGDGTPMTDSDFYMLHPYDRALEYCASLYDIVTNESGTKILYWCKYYGIYPTKVAPTLNNENNQAITEMSVSASFKYHYKLENSNRTFIEFNHDAGILDMNGNRIGSAGDLTNSDPFLYKNEPMDLVLPQYIGAAGMFTGSPYVIVARSNRPNPIEPSKNQIYTPLLRFLNIKDDTINTYANLRMQSDPNATGVQSFKNYPVSY